MRSDKLLRSIYFPLAKSSGKVLELLRALKAKEGDRQKKLFQFLNELGARMLRTHMGRVLEMAESSDDRYAYEKKIVDRFGGQQELDLIVPAEPQVCQPCSNDEAANYGGLATMSAFAQPPSDASEPMNVLADLFFGRGAAAEQGVE